MPTTWEQLLLTADSDCIAFILLSECGMLESTTLWKAPHSIEKYLKSYLLKSDPTINVINYSHNLMQLWAKCIEISPKNCLFQDTNYRAFVEEINMEDNNIQLRYSYGIEIKDPIFIKTYVPLSCLLRLLILGKKQFRQRGSYGLCNASFGGSTSFFENPKINVKEIVCGIIARAYNGLP